MGSFEAHVGPGVVIAIYGLAWCINSIWLHLKTRPHRGHCIPSNVKPNIQNKILRTCCRIFSSGEDRYSDSNLTRKSWIPTPFLSHLPIEPFMRAFVGMLGILEEEFLGFSPDHHLITIIYTVRWGDGQLGTVDKFFHITMYSFFLLSGVIDLLSYCVRFPKPTSIIIFSLAFFNEALLFHFHTIGRDQFNTLAHVIVVLTIISCFIFSLLRLYSPSNLVINLGLSGSLLAQGLWFIQIGHLVFGSFLSPGEKVTHDHLMLIIAYFSWQIFVIIIFILVLLGALTLLDNILWSWKRNRRAGYRKILEDGWCGSREGVTEEEAELVHKDSPAKN